MPPPTVTGTYEMRSYDFSMVDRGDWVGEIIQLTRDERRSEVAYVGRALYETLRMAQDQVLPHTYESGRHRPGEVDIFGTRVVYVPTVGEFGLQLVLVPEPEPRYEVRFADIRSRRFNMIDRAVRGPTINIDEVRARRFDIPPAPAPTPRSVWERLGDDD